MSLQNPLHPGVILTALKISKQRLMSVQIVMPPNSQVTFAIAPPVGMIWVVGVHSIGVLRDFITGNPMNTALFTIEAEHPSIGRISTQGVDSAVKAPWGTVLDLSSSSPLVVTFTNSTALFIALDFAQGIFDMPQRLYDEVYLKMWNGLENILLFMGQYNSEEIGMLSNMLKGSLSTDKKNSKKFLKEEQ